MKKTINIALLLAATLTLQARTQQQTAHIARQLLSKPERIDYGQSLSLYNDADQKGFVIVSKSDRMRPVIGYSDSGSIDTTAIPDNMRSWLQWVDQATTYLESHPECALTASQLSEGVTPVSPLLGDIAWDQDDPFNRQCPKVNGKRSVVGCVATAAAQCVYYHKWPTTGVGSHTSTGSPSDTIDYSAQTYDYSLMYDYYKSSYSSSRHNEVAKLSYHCGVLSDMKYSPEGSAAYVQNLQRGLVENFGYSPYAQNLYRSCYTYEEWSDILQGELQAGRPIIYSGTSQEIEAGHCFVVDGINSEGLYHVNWGWSGSADGYYDIVVLNPIVTGIGAAYCNDGFSAEQEALIQVAPPSQLTSPTYYPALCGSEGTFTLLKSSVSLGRSITMSLTDTYNMTEFSVKGKVGLAFCQNGEVIKTSTFSDAISLDPWYGGTFKGSITVPSSLDNGTYQVYACFIPTSGDLEGECGLIHVDARTSSYYDCTVSNSRATFSRPDYSLQLSTSDWSCADAAYAPKTDVAITCSVTNLSDTNTVVGRFYLELVSPSSDTSYVEADQVLTLTPLAQGQLSFDCEFKELGTWHSNLYFFWQGLDYDPEESRIKMSGTEQTFVVTNDTSAIETLAASDENDSPSYNVQGQQLPSAQTGRRGIIVSRNGCTFVK
ncbi:MAG: C10 family peptidase [Bacteroidales bacterium]|nr:C10 family peptidase [Bacteroidales bacterium]